MGCSGLGAWPGRPKLAGQKPALPGYCLAVSLAGIKSLGTEPHRHNKLFPLVHMVPAQALLYLPRLDIQVAETSLACLLRQNRCTVMPCGVVIQKMMVPLQRQGWHGEYKKALWSLKGETPKGCWVILRRRGNKSLTFAVLKANEHNF